MNIEFEFDYGFYTWALPLSVSIGDNFFMVHFFCLYFTWFWFPKDAYVKWQADATASPVEVTRDHAGRGTDA